MATAAQNAQLAALQARASGGGNRFESNFALGQLRGLANQEADRATFAEVMAPSEQEKLRQKGALDTQRQDQEFALKELAQPREFGLSEVALAQKGILDQRKLRQAKANEALERELDPNKKAEFELQGVVTKLKTSMVMSEQDKLDAQRKAAEEGVPYIDPFNEAAVTLGMLDKLPKGTSPELVGSMVHDAMVKNSGAAGLNNAGLAKSLNSMGVSLLAQQDKAIDKSIERQKKLGDIALLNAKALKQASVGSEVPKTLVSKFTEKSVNKSQIATDLGSIAKLYKPELFNKLGVTKIKGLMQLEGLGKTLTNEQKDSVNSLVTMRTQVVQLFNAYRKDITGAAASNQELDRLEKGFIHMNMSPTEFTVAVEGLQSVAQQQAAYWAKAATKGSAFTLKGTEWLADIRANGPKDDADRAMLKASDKWEKARSMISDKGDWDSLRGPDIDESGDAVDYGDIDSVGKTSALDSINAELKRRGLL